MAVLGMRGTGSFGANERPTNFREQLLREYPSGGAVFMMLLGMLPSEAVDSTKFTIFEQGLPQQRFVIASASGGATNADDTTFVLSTTLPIANSTPSKSWRKGMLGRIETTGEIFLVTADPTGSDTNLTVYRGVGNSGTGLLFTDGDACTVIGPCDEEGADVGSGISYDPSERYNLVETFRTPLELTDDAAQEYYRTGNILQNKKFDAAQDHSMQQEKAFLFGKRDSFTLAGETRARRTTGGLYYWLAGSYKTDFTTTGVTKAGLYSALQPIYTVPNGSGDKVALCGATALGVINDLAEEHADINVEPRENTYGLQIRTLVHPWGELKLIPHPLLAEHSDWTKMMFIIDTRNVRYRFLRGRDTRFLRDRQGNGVDAVIHEFMTKAGLEIRFLRTHGIFEGMSEYVA